MHKKLFKILAVILTISILSVGITMVVAQEIEKAKQDISKYDKIVQTLNETVVDEDEFNEIMYNYEYVAEAYNASQNDLNYIAGLIIDGANPKDVISIYHFWRDTSEDKIIIEQIYNLKSKYAGSLAWIEDAFNDVTNDKCGVLDINDINEYQERGLSISDIVAANTLCRKGVYTIQQILEKRLSGITFEEISNDIYSNLSANSSNEINYAKTKNQIKNENTDDFINSMRLANITNESVSVYLDEAKGGEDLSRKLAEKNSEISNKVSKKLKEKNVLKKSKRSEELNKPVIDSFIEKIKDNDISEDQISVFIDAGYEYVDIFNASLVAKNGKGKIGELLERFKNGESWITILEGGAANE